MLPSLTARGRDLRRTRLALAVAGALLIAVAVLSAQRGDTPASAAAAPLADRLAASSWAIAVPNAWFVAPLVGLRPGDRVDVLALRAGERATASAIAFDMEVMSVDERTIVLGAGASDVTALAVARASGQLIVPLLRSAR